MNVASTRRTWLALLLVSPSFAAETIDWHHWELDAFETAKAQDYCGSITIGSSIRK